MLLSSWEPNNESNGSSVSFVGSRNSSHSHWICRRRTNDCPDFPALTKLSTSGHFATDWRVILDRDWLLEWWLRPGCLHQLLEHWLLVIATKLSRGQFEWHGHLSANVASHRRVHQGEYWRQSLLLLLLIPWLWEELHDRDRSMEKMLLFFVWFPWSQRYDLT